MVLRPNSYSSYLGNLTKFYLSLNVAQVASGILPNPQNSLSSFSLPSPPPSYWVLDIRCKVQGFRLPISFNLSPTTYLTPLTPTSHRKNHHDFCIDNTHEDNKQYRGHRGIPHPEPSEHNVGALCQHWLAKLQENEQYN